MRVIKYLAIISLVIVGAGVLIEFALGKTYTAGQLVFWFIVLALIAYYLDKREKKHAK